MKSRLSILFASDLFLMANICLSQGNTVIVPDDFSTIQAAINASISGDSILIRPGVYFENLTIMNKGLFISSINEIGTEELMYETIIDGGHQGCVMYIRYCSDTLLLHGLTLCNGYGEHAGAIYCGNSLLKMSSMLLRDNETWMSEAHGGGGLTATEDVEVFMKNVIITGNKAYNFGGGIKLRYDAILHGENVIIAGNYCGGGGHSKGGGISVDYGSKVYLYRSVISNNSATYWGGGIAAGGQGSAFVSLVNCTMTGNFAGYGGGAVYACYDNNKVFLGNCILMGNLADPSNPHDQEIHFDDTGDNNILAYVSSDIEGGQEAMYIPAYYSLYDLGGNLNSIPYFKPDLRLASSSLCIDAGIDYFSYWGETLINIPESQYSGDAPDLGAFENLNIVVNAPQETSEKNGLLKVYPNPADHLFTVEIEMPSDCQLDLSLHDITGKCLEVKTLEFKGQMPQKVVFQVDELVTGQYVIRATGNGYALAAKVLVE